MKVVAPFHLWIKEGHAMNDECTEQLCHVSTKKKQVKFDKTKWGMKDPQLQLQQMCS